ncbi:MAG: aminotransferase class V-fold PLP-dependent enzyme [Clostridiales bacterium]
MIYFDNAATSFPKPEFVYKEMDKCLREYCANPGRGSHKISLKSGEMVFETREKISKFFNISDPMRIAFTKNATEAINYGIRGLLEENDHIITTSMEHNSVIRPLKHMENEKNIDVSIIKGNNYGVIDEKEIEKAIKKNTKLIVTTLSSNVNGIILPIKEIGKIAKDNGIIYLLDASQGAGTIDINLKELYIDIMVFPGHKCLFGPQGVGGLYIKDTLELNSIIQGGTGTDSQKLFQPEYMPELFESGTLNTPGIAGLNAGISYINLIGKEKIRKHKYNLVKNLIDGMKEIDGIKIYSKDDYDNNSGIVAFEFEDIESREIGYVLNDIYEICVRTGLHCAPLAHETLRTLDKGLVRVSFSYFNTVNEVSKLLDILNDIRKSLCLRKS